MTIPSGKQGCQGSTTLTYYQQNITKTWGCPDSAVYQSGIRVHL